MYEEVNTAKWIVGGIALVIAVIVGWVIVSMAVMPSYRIYKQNKQGKPMMKIKSVKQL